MKKYTFNKEERLCSKRLITDLFNKGSSFLLYPYRVTYLPNDETKQPDQVLFSVSKRRFPHAVQRNLLKRRMREAFRLQKDELLYAYVKQRSFGLILAIQYVAKEVLDYRLIHERMADVLVRLQHESVKACMGKSN